MLKQVVIVLDNSAQIAARWGYMGLWAQAMFDSYGKPPACPSWLEFAFQCWYGNDNTLWPDPTQRDSGNGPDVGMIQSCALALLQGPQVLIQITARTAMNTYKEDLKPPSEKQQEKPESTKLCKHYMTVKDMPHCILNGIYKQCPFMGDRSSCDMKGLSDEQ